MIYAALTISSLSMFFVLLINPNTITIFTYIMIKIQAVGPKLFQVSKMGIQKFILLDCIWVITQKLKRTINFIMQYNQMRPLRCGSYIVTLLRRQPIQNQSNIFKDMENRKFLHKREMFISTSVYIIIDMEILSKGSRVCFKRSARNG